MEKKAEKPVLLDLRKLDFVWDYFIICSANSSPHLEAIYETVIKKAKEYNIEIHHTELDGESKWILIDFFDIVLHIFSQEARLFYDLEHLWKEAKKISWKKFL